MQMVLSKPGTEGGKENIVKSWMLDLPHRKYDTVDAALQVVILLAQVPLHINGIPRTTSCREILMRDKSTFTKR